MSRIKSITAWSADLGNVKPYTIAFKTIDEVRNAFVCITLENGLTGLGAGNPSQYVTGESLDQTLAALEEKNLSFMIGADIREFQLLNSLYADKFPKCPAARAAVDIALHDAFTQYLGIPLVNFLGRKIKSLPTSNTIGIKNVADTLAEAKEYGERGFSILKIKLGKELEEDIERIVKLRERFGGRFIIRVDANQGYTTEETIEFYRRTRSLAIELIEQPLPARAVNELKGLPDEIRTIIAADESLLTPADALMLVSDTIATGIFNIKLMKCGGISEALKIAAIAKPADVSLFWGCNDESAISITAALHAAFACTHTRFIDLDGSLDLAQDIVTGGFILQDGVMSCSDKPGLGVERISG